MHVLVVVMMMMVRILVGRVVRIRGIRRRDVRRMVGQMSMREIVRFLRRELFAPRARSRPARQARSAREGFAPPDRGEVVFGGGGG